MTVNLFIIHNYICLKTKNVSAIYYFQKKIKFLSKIFKTSFIPIMADISDTQNWLSYGFELMKTTSMPIINILSYILKEWLGLFEKQPFYQIIFDFFFSKNLHQPLTASADTIQKISKMDSVFFNDPAFILSLLFLIFLILKFSRNRLKNWNIVGNTICRFLNWVVMFVEYNFFRILPFYTIPVLYSLSALINDQNFSFWSGKFTSTNFNHLPLIQEKFCYMVLVLFNAFAIVYMFYMTYKAKTQSKYSSLFGIRILIFIVFSCAYLYCHYLSAFSLGIAPMLIFSTFDNSRIMDLYIVLGIVLVIIYIIQNVVLYIIRLFRDILVDLKNFIKILEIENILRNIRKSKV